MKAAAIIGTALAFTILAELAIRLVTDPGERGDYDLED